MSRVKNKPSVVGKKAESPDALDLQPRFRILRGAEIALGPGKAELLEHLHATGSISLAAESMGLSYMRAWNLIQTMNRCFKEPLVVSLRGGKIKGGAMLTPAGNEVLTLYKRMETECLGATTSSWKVLRALLRSR
ncbi:MAG: LysR family transcriptional regulator [Verrucomicrobiota bacterium]